MGRIPVLMLTVIWFVAAALPMANWAMAASPLRVEKLRVIAAGLFTAENADPVPLPNSAIGHLTPASRFKLLKRQTTIPASLGTRFGVEFELVGRPHGEEVTITCVTRFPAGGLTNPATGRTVQRNEFPWRVKLGVPSFRTYLFEEPFELATGTWVLEFWYEDRKLAEQVFTVEVP